jgi:hypothetical protein
MKIIDRVPLKGDLICCMNGHLLMRARRTLSLCDLISVDDFDFFQRRPEPYTARPMGCVICGPDATHNNVQYAPVAEPEDDA